jgi:transaldolase
VVVHGYTSVSDSGDRKNIGYDMKLFIDSADSREIAECAATGSIDGVTIKLPLTRDGLKACRALSNRGRKVNVTLCFQPVQAVVAAQ